MAYSQEELNNITDALILDNNTNEVTPAKVRQVFKSVISTIATTDATVVSATPPLNYDAFTNVFYMLKADATHNGYLSNEDWAVFETVTGKLDIVDYNDRFKGVYPSLSALESAVPTASAGDYAQVNTTGSDKVVNYNWDTEDNSWAEGGSGGSGATNTDALPEGSSNLYFSTSRVLATLLTGISFATGATVIATDSILIGFGKIQKQINDLGTKFVDFTSTQDISGLKTFLSGKLGLRNVANTFTSYLSNTNTASRIYTLQNRNGILADDTDLLLKMNVALANPALSTGAAKALTVDYLGMPVAVDLQGIVVNTIALVAGIATVSISGVLTTSIGMSVQVITPSGVLGLTYKMTCVSGSLIITSIDSAGSTIVTDNSVVSYTILL